MIKKLLSVTLLALLVLAMLIPAAHAETTMYVYTENGQTLNVRSSERVDNNVVGQLAFGTAVRVRSSYNGWSEIVYPWGDSYGFRVDYAYVQSRYLVSYDPSYDPSNDPVTPEKDLAKAFNEMNAEFRTARKVTPFNVVSRPSRATGWVNLRYAPSLQAERIATCPQGKVLTVLAELQNWYQVQDPTTGMVGYISRQYVSRQSVGTAQ